MGGILDWIGMGGNSAPTNGGILGPIQQTPEWADKLNIFGATLRDMGANLGGHPADATALAPVMRQQQTRALLAALTSSDPATRQLAYSQAMAMGVDPSSFQKAQASQAMPKLMGNMQPQFNSVDVTPQVTSGNPGPSMGPTGLPMLSTASPSRQASYDKPLTYTPTLSQALQDTGSPELTSQMGPEIIKQQLADQVADRDKRRRPATAAELKAANLSPDTSAEIDNFGNMTVLHQSDVPSQGKLAADLYLKNNDPMLAVARQNANTSAARLKMDGEDAGGGLSDAAKINAAVKFNLTGQMPAFGMGKAARGDRLEVLNYAAQLATGKKSPEQLVADAANYKANSSSLNKLTTQFNAIEQNSNTAKNSLNLALHAAQDGGTGPTDSPVFNRWVQAGRVAVDGDPKVQALQNHLSAFAEDYAKVMTANAGNAAATDDARKAAYQRLSGANSFGNMQQIGGEMLKEMGGRHYATRAQIDSVKSQLGGGAYKEPNGVQTKAPVLPPKLPLLPKSDPKTDALLKKYGVTK